MSFFTDLSNYSFLQNAAIGGLLASLICGLIGPFVVIRKMSSLAGGISHSVLGGMGAAFYFGFSAQLGSLLAACISALVLGFVHLKRNEEEDTTIAVLWAGGMALGVLFMSWTPGYDTRLQSALFGNLLMVSDKTLYYMASLTFVVFAFIAFFYHQMIAITFDERFASLRGLPTKAFYLLLMILVACSAVILVQVVGLILVIALLSIPAAVASIFAHSLRSLMLYSALLGTLLTLSGLVISYEANTPTGATIILISAVVYLSSRFAN
jgi:zinc transport system permease protein